MRAPRLGAVTLDPSPIPSSPRSEQLLAKGEVSAESGASALLLGLGPASAGRPGLDLLGQFASALGHVLDLGYDRFRAEAAGVDQVALPAAEQGEAEVSDRRIRDDRNGGLQGAIAPRRGLRTRY